MLLFKKNASEVFSLDSAGILQVASNGQLYHYNTIIIGNIAADIDALLIPIWKPDHEITIFKAEISVNADIVDDDVNYQTIILEDSSDAAVATLTSDITWTAGTLVTMGSITNAAITSSETLRLDITKTSSGKAMLGLTLVLTYQITG